MKISIYNPTNIKQMESTIDETLVKESRPENISATLLPDTEKDQNVAEIETEER